MTVRMEKGADMYELVTQIIVAAKIVVVVVLILAAVVYAVPDAVFDVFVVTVAVVADVDVFGRVILVVLEIVVVVANTFVSTLEKKL